MANDFDDAADWLQDEINYDVEELSMLVMDECVMRSPVDTGRFRGNWIASVNKETERERETALTASPLPLARAVLKRALRSKVEIREIYIQNNLPYSGTIDDGLYPNPPKSGDKTQGGYSKQAPRGISDLAIKAALERSK